MHIKSIALALALPAIMLAACSTTISDDNRYTPLINGPVKLPVQPASPPAYIQATDKTRELGTRRVSVNAPEVSIGELVATALPDLLLQTGDSGVDLNKRIAVSVRDMPLPDFLDYLGSRSDYDFTIKSGTTPLIYVASIAHRTYNLAAISSNRKSTSKVGKSGDSGQGGGGGGGGQGGGAGAGSSGGQSSSQARRATEITITDDQDEWERTINQLRGILQQEGEKTSANVLALRTAGIVDISGKPSAVRTADRFIQSVLKFSEKTVHMGLSIHEVSLNDSKSTGIRWDLLTDGFSGNVFNGANVAANFPSAASVANPGLVTINAFAGLRDDSLKLLLSFLSQYGKVNLLTQPNITVVNGRSATLNSGQEFSYVESVITNTTSQGTSTITPVLARILVGVEFSITPRVLDDERVLIDVVPIVSNLQSFQDFTVGDTSFQTPRIAINEMATQVIVKSGETVHIGGLITDRIQETINRLPTDQGNFLADLFFNSRGNTLERRELVLTISPRIL